jgi:hypothetical protein
MNQLVGLIGLHCVQEQLTILIDLIHGPIVFDFMIIQGHVSRYT